MSFAGFVAVMVVILLVMVALGIGKKSKGGTGFSCLVALGVLALSPVVFAYIVEQINGAVSKPVQRDFWVLMHGMKLSPAALVPKAADVKEGADRTAAEDQQLRNQCLAMVAHVANLGDKTSVCIKDARAGGAKYQQCLTFVINQFGNAQETLQAESCGTNPQKEIDELVGGTAAATACGYLVRVNAVIDLINRVPYHPVTLPFLSKCPLPDESVVK